MPVETSAAGLLTDHVGTRIHPPLISREADPAKDPGPCPEVSLETSAAGLLTDHVGTRIHPQRIRVHVERCPWRNQRRDSSLTTWGPGSTRLGLGGSTHSKPLSGPIQSQPEWIRVPTWTVRHLPLMPPRKPPDMDPDPLQHQVTEWIRVPTFLERWIATDVSKETSGHGPGSLNDANQRNSLGY